VRTLGVFDLVCRMFVSVCGEMNGHLGERAGDVIRARSPTIALVRYVWLAIIAVGLLPVALLGFFANPLVFIVLGSEEWRARLMRFYRTAGGSASPLSSVLARWSSTAWSTARNDTDAPCQFENLPSASPPGVPRGESGEPKVFVFARRARLGLG
jgi:hypothetical protein